MCPMAAPVTTQLALGVSIALLLAGCGNGPTSPSAHTTPTTPGIAGSSSFPAGPYVASGAVTDAVGPIVGANVNAFVITSGIGYSYMYAHGALLSDGGRHYRMTDLPGGAHLWFQVYKDGYVQQCAVPSVTIEGDLTMDLALVTKSNVTASATQAAPTGCDGYPARSSRTLPRAKSPSQEQASILNRSKIFLPPLPTAMRPVDSPCAGCRRTSRSLSTQDLAAASPM